MVRRRQSQGVRCCGGGDGGDASARAPATSAAEGRVSPPYLHPLSTNLGLKGFTHLGQNSGQKRGFAGAKFALPRVGSVVRPSFSAPPPLSLPKLSFPVNWGWERIHEHYTQPTSRHYSTLFVTKKGLTLFGRCSPHLWNVRLRLGRSTFTTTPSAGLSAGLSTTWWTVHSWSTVRWTVHGGQ